MTMALPASPPAPASSAALDQVLRIVIVLFGAIEGILHFSDLSILLGGRPGDPVLLATAALHPILGFAAVGFALAKKLRLGIATLAVLALAQWASDAPPIISDGVTFSASAFLNADAIFRSFIQPVIGCGAIAAAWFNRHLTAATLAVTLPTLANVAGIAAFAIGVIMYGF